MRRASRIFASTHDKAELVLYDLLRKEGGNAYGRYNALIRELVSFGRALARYQRQLP